MICNLCPAGVGPCAQRPRAGAYAGCRRRRWWPMRPSTSGRSRPSWARGAPAPCFSPAAPWGVSSARTTPSATRTLDGPSPWSGCVPSASSSSTRGPTTSTWSIPPTMPTRWPGCWPGRCRCRWCGTLAATTGGHPAGPGGKIQIYLPDLKYVTPEYAEQYSGAADYPEAAQAAILGDVPPDRPLCIEDGLLKRGRYHPAPAPSWEIGRGQAGDGLGGALRPRRGGLLLMSQYSLGRAAEFPR